jgi:hypothetical protein
MGICDVCKSALLGKRNHFYFYWALLCEFYPFASAARKGTNGDCVKKKLTVKDGNISFLSVRSESTSENDNKVMSPESELVPILKNKKLLRLQPEMIGPSDACTSNMMDNIIGMLQMCPRTMRSYGMTTIL